MALIKLCGRGHKNPPHAIMCEECLEDLSRVPLTEDNEDNDLEIDAATVEVDLDAIDLEDPTLLPRTPPTIPVDDELVIVFPQENLRLQTEEGEIFTVCSGDIVGRAQAGSDILQNYPTVSRFNLRLTCRERIWFVSNLSDNGTWVNGQEALTGEEIAIKPGDELALSSKCRLKILP